jgi:MoxR-like ATPase
VLRDGFLAGVGQAVPVDVQWLTRATEAFEKQLEIETSAPARSDDDGAGKLALARAIAGPGAHDVGQGLVRMVADQARKRYSGLHLAARGAQVQEVLDRAVAALQAVQATAEAMRTQAHAHAWLPPTWRDAIEAVHRDNVRTLAQLRARLQGVAEGFAELPVDPALAAVEPAAVQILA